MKLLKSKNEFLYLVMLGFIFISSTALVLSKEIEKLQEEDRKVTKIFAPIPKVAENSSFPVISAQGALAIDMTTGIPLYEKNPDSPLLPASTTKIVTALVAFDTYPMDSILKVL